MPENDPKDGDKGAAGAAPAAGAGAPPPEPPKKLEMTQEDLDRIIAERVARAKPKDYDDLVKLRDEQAAAAEKEKTDLQKAQDAKAAAEKERDEAIAAANSTLITAAIITEAAAQKAADAGVVAQLLAGSEDVTVEKGVVKGAKQAVKKLLEEKPFLVAAGTPPGASGGQFGGNDSRTLQERIQEAESKKDWGAARRLKAEQAIGSR